MMSSAPLLSMATANPLSVITANGGSLYFTLIIHIIMILWSDNRWGLDW
jgi:hypothetical protein